MNDTPQKAITPDDAQRAHEQYNLYCKHRADAERSFILMGGDFLRFYEGETWRALGFGSYEEFCEAPLESGGCGVASYRTAMRWASIYRRYIRELRQEEEDLVKVGVYKLDMLLPHVNSDNVEDQLARAESLSRNDMEQELRKRPDTNDPKGKPPAFTIQARPIRLWPFEDAPPEFKNLFPDTEGEDIWLVHTPPQHNTIQVGIVDIETKEKADMKTLQDGSEVWIYL